MKSNLISKENGIAKFTMEFTPEEFEKSKDTVYKFNKDQFNIDGFRKGKAPRSIIEKHYGQDVFAQEAINNLLSIHYYEVTKELGLEVINRPDIEVKDELKPGEGFKAEATVQIYPEVTIKDYKGIEIEEEKTPVTDKEVDAELEAMRHRNARMISVDRPVADGDMVTLDYKGYFGEDQFEGGTAEGYSLKIGSNTFIPGFEEQLIGAEKEKDIEIKVTFPEEYHATDMAGKDAVFKCLIHEIKEEELPELDDEFAKDVSEFDTLDELKNSTKEDLEKRHADYDEQKMRDNMIEKAMELNDFDIPGVMIEDEVNQMIKEFDQQLQQQGLGLDQYLEYMGKSKQEFGDGMQDNAEKRVRTRMIVRGIAEQENIEVTDEEIEEDLKNAAEQYGLELDKLKEMIGDENKENVAQDLKMRKAVTLMMDNAKKVPKAEKAEETTDEKDGE